MSPDAIGHRYLQAAERVGPRAICLYVSTGAYCPHCPRGESGRPRTTRKGALVCDRCAQAWEPQTQWVLKSGVSRGHPDTHRRRWDKASRSFVTEPRYGARPGASHQHGRTDLSDLRLAEHVDEIRRVQAMVETVPPQVAPMGWCYSVSAWLAALLMVEPAAVPPFVGYQADGDSLDRVCSWGQILRPHLGPWERERVKPAIEEARRYVGIRQTYRHWAELESMTEERDWLRPSEAARELRIEVRTVYDLIRAGHLEAFERGSPGAKRRTIGVTRRSVQEEKRRRNIQETVRKTREFLDRK